jgi:hypothetical protein
VQSAESLLRAGVPKDKVDSFADAATPEAEKDAFARA